MNPTDARPDTQGNGARGDGWPGTTPVHAEPVARYDLNDPAELPPRPPLSPWALTGRVLASLVIAALTAGVAILFVQLRSTQGQLRTTEATAAKAVAQDGQLSRALGVNASQTSANGGTLGNLSGSVGSLAHQLQVIRAQLANPPIPHYGICVKTWTDNSTDDISNVVITDPVAPGTCGQGTYVSAVPGG